MLHLPALIIDLTLILGAAAAVTLIFKRLKQPVVLGYIIAGLIIGPSFNLFPTILETDSIKIWADIGVIFLLFGLGLEFSFKRLIKVGGVAIVTALTEVTLTMGVGFGLGRLLGWNTIDSLFLGGILAIASTTIIIRAFDELGVKNQKFASVVTGVLVIEDLVAVLLMVMLSTVAVSKTFAGGEMIMSVLKLAFFLVLWFVSGIFFLPTLLQKLRLLLNDETLLIVSLALCFLMVALATYVGFSPALGAFIMGSILAETTKAERIEHLLKSVKNLFGAIFFISVGMLIDPQMMVQYALPIFAATLVLLFAKPLFVVFGATLAGQPLRIAMQSGMSLSQIGEFSFIIAALGLSLNVTSSFLYPIAVAVSVITTFTTPYMIRLSEPVYKTIEGRLPQNIKNLLAKYSLGTQNISEVSDWKKVLRFYLINVIVFSVIIVFIIILSTKYLEPLFSGYEWSRVITVMVSLAVLAPFLWALAFRRTQRQAYANVWINPARRRPLIMLLFSRVLLAVFYIGFLFHRLFSPKIALMGVVVASIILLILSRRIKAFYGQIELRFLTNYHARETETDSKVIPTPWDTHITSFVLSPQSPYIGKTLFEARLREDFGINIAAIERGDLLINIPNRFEHLYPHDNLMVIGTDEQLNKFNKHLDDSVNETPTVDIKKHVALHQFTVGSRSPLISKSIRISKIRERSKGLVVGIERNGQRLLNPESDMLFEEDDKVWIVGNEKRIQILLKELAD
ncbi:cation:proton antiporter domain-containing protein [Williamwhitmania taraxaci]|uniref:Transporter, CPA2 family n=1 Tax=Williamwhitmania taraxaci TaxID=1640674 RepID=A0A1G6GTF9_9BACT|nr:cation:proton antiporter [Williamwhitmania taraxaci]SDB85310.1 transporter, CPA2 family [Williamwhitmania taraxaci]